MNSSRLHEYTYIALVKVDDSLDRPIVSFDIESRQQLVPRRHC